MKFFSKLFGGDCVMPSITMDFNLDKGRKCFDESFSMDFTLESTITFDERLFLFPRTCTDLYTLEDYRLLNLYIYIYIYIYMCVCVCVSFTFKHKYNWKNIHACMRAYELQVITCTLLNIWYGF